MRRHNYEELYFEYLALKSATKLELMDFAKQKNINYSQLSRNFNDIKRSQDLEAFRLKNPTILLQAQANVERALQTVKLKPEFKASYSLDALKAIADREGLSPAASVINIQNTNTQNTALVPLFAGESPDLKQLLGGE